MNSRLELQTLLESIMGNRNVYFQPPSSVQMHYPAIVYSHSRINNNFADNGVYIQRQMYEITVIDENPESEIVKQISKLPTCQFSRSYKSDNLNHCVFTLFF